MDNASLSRLIARIYDCAVDPSEWQPTLVAIRDELDCAFASVHFMDFAPTYPATPPETIVFHSGWDEDWLTALQPLVGLIPEFDQMRNAAIDVPITQLQLVDEATFRTSEFCRRWVAPQGLRDTMNTKIIGRQTMTAMFSAPTFQHRELFGEADFTLMRLLTPHIRRALLINDLLDKRRLRLQIYRQLLDRLSVAVILVETNARVVYCNEVAEALLDAGTALTTSGGRLVARSDAHRQGFLAAIERACMSDETSLGSWGSGIPLPAAPPPTATPTDAPTEAAAVAYVLPLGRSERRRALGPGLAAVFVTTLDSARLPSIEVLAALSGLTSA